MTDLHVTQHAIERALERGVALEALTCPAVQAAASFGAPYVRIATGQRIVIADGSIITVLPAECKVWRLARDRRNATGARRG